MSRKGRRDSVRALRYIPRDIGCRLGLSINDIMQEGGEGGGGLVVCMTNNAEGCIDKNDKEGGGGR